MEGARGFGENVGWKQRVRTEDAMPSFFTWLFGEQGWYFIALCTNHLFWPLDGEAWRNNNQVELATGPATILMTSAKFLRSSKVVLFYQTILLGLVGRDQTIRNMASFGIPILAHALRRPLARVHEHTRLHDTAIPLPLVLL